MPLVKEQARRAEPLEHNEMVVSTFLKEVAVARHGEMLGSTPWAGAERGTLENTVERIVMSLGKTPGGKEVVSELARRGREIKIPGRDEYAPPTSATWKRYLAQEAVYGAEIDRIQNEQQGYDIRADRIWTSAVGTAANVLTEYISQTRSGEAVINHLAARRVMGMAKAEGKTELAKLDELKRRFTDEDYGKLQVEINRQLAGTQFKTLPGVR